MARPEEKRQAVLGMPTVTMAVYNGVRGRGLLAQRETALEAIDPGICETTRHGAVFPALHRGPL